MAEFKGRCCRVHNELITIVDTPAPLHPAGYIRTVEGQPIEEWRKAHQVLKDRDRVEAPAEASLIIVPGRKGSP